MSSRSLLPSLAFLLLTAGFSWAQSPEVPAEILPPEPVDTPALAAPSLLSCDGDCGCDSECRQRSRIWARAEYLLWRMKASPLPTSMVINPTGFTTADLQTGAIFNKPSLIGDDLAGSVRHGGRFSAGIWLDPGQILGVEGSYFFIGDQTNGRNAAGTTLGSPVNVSFSPPGATIPGSGVYVLGGPNAPATARVEIANSLQGADFNGVFNLYRGSYFRLGLLAGFRWFEFRETLNYEAASNRVEFASAGTQGGNSFSTVATNLSPNLLTLGDRFATTNTFNGGQVGARAEFAAGSLFANVTGKVALGTMREVIDVAGVNTPFQGFVPTLAHGGMYAQPSNIGHHVQDDFAVAPELSANVGWQLTSWLRASAGYTFFYVNKVVRPGNQMQSTFDVTPVFTARPGTVPSSATFFNESSFWAQGINFSLEFQY
jgi:hypothetical protein